MQAVTCGKSEYPDCAAEGYGALAHYSRNGLIDGWKLHYPGNQFCWSEWVTDSEIDAEWIVDQPGRPYTPLCIVKIAKCPVLPLRSELGKNVTHYHLDFAVPC